MKSNSAPGRGGGRNRNQKNNKKTPNPNKPNQPTSQPKKPHPKTDPSEKSQRTTDNPKMLLPSSPASRSKPQRRIPQLPQPPSGGTGGGRTGDADPTLAGSGAHAACAGPGAAFASQAQPQDGAVRGPARPSRPSGAPQPPAGPCRAWPRGRGPSAGGAALPGPTAAGAPPGLSSQPASAGVSPLSLVFSLGARGARKSEMILIKCFLYGNNRALFV